MLLDGLLTHQVSSDAILDKIYNHRRKPVSYFAPILLPLFVPILGDVRNNKLITGRITSLERTAEILHVPFCCLFPVSIASKDINMTDGLEPVPEMSCISDSERKSNNAGREGVC